MRAGVWGKCATFVGQRQGERRFERAMHGAAARCAGTLLLLAALIQGLYPTPAAAQQDTAPPAGSTASEAAPVEMAQNDDGLDDASVPVLATIPVTADHAETARAEPPPRRPQLEEIVVTAQKREESLSKTPLAISAFDEKAMEKLGGNTLNNSTTLVPNLQNSTGGFAIRGVGSSTHLRTAPTVAMHIDGIYSDDDPRGLSTNWDIARVEVLRGPQGTLYGRNATAGAVNIITTKPTDEFELFGDISRGTADEWLLRLVLNQPVSDSFALRLAASRVQNDGLQKNQVPGESNATAADTGFARLSGRWTPIDTLSWDASLEYQRDDSVVRSRIIDWYVSKPNRQTAIVYPSGLSRDHTPPQGPRAEEFGSFAQRNSGLSEAYQWRSALRYSFDERWSLSWLTGYRDFETNANTNTVAMVLVERSLRGNDSRWLLNIHTQELNLHFEGDRSHGVFGLYYFEKESEDEDVVHIWTPTRSSGPDNPPRLNPTADLGRAVYGPSYEKSRAAFGQLTYSLTPALRFTGGLRYTEDRLERAPGRATLCLFADIRDPDDPPSPSCQALDQSGAFNGAFGPFEQMGAKRDWSAWNWKVTADYDVNPDLLAYATAATGYKQGAITGVDVRGVHAVDPETNTNYEVGLRQQLFDGAASFNLTAFWMNFVDLQVSISQMIGGAPTLGYDNLGEARLRGMEAEMSWQLTEADRIDGYATYLDATITRFPNASDPMRGADFSFDATGNRPSASPEYTFRIGYTRSTDFGRFGALRTSISTYHSAYSYAQYTNGPQDRNPAYWRSDLFLQYDSADQRYSVAAFVSNIEDEQVRSSVFPFLTEATDTEPGGGMQFSEYSIGRTYGLRLGYRF